MHLIWPYFSFHIIVYVTWECFIPGIEEAKRRKSQGQSRMTSSLAWGYRLSGCKLHRGCVFSQVKTDLEIDLATRFGSLRDFDFYLCYLKMITLWVSQVEAKRTRLPCFSWKHWDLFLWGGLSECWFIPTNHPVFI